MPLRRAWAPTKLDEVSFHICAKHPQKNTGGHYCSGTRDDNKGPAPSPSSACRASFLHCVSANRLDDILDAVTSKRAVTEFELILDLIVNGLRNTNRARLGECLEPGGDVDAIAK